MSAPKVSVVIPAYQVTQFIAQTLDSVFAQTYNDFETIVVNDGCPDTAALEAVLQPYLPRLRYCRQENRGPSGTRNTGIRMARGEFIALLDSDDLWMPEFLEQQMCFLEDNPSLGMVWCDSHRLRGYCLGRSKVFRGLPIKPPGDLGKVDYRRVRANRLLCGGEASGRARCRGIRRKPAPGRGLRHVAAAGLCRCEDGFSERASRDAGAPGRVRFPPTATPNTKPRSGSAGNSRHRSGPATR